MTASAGTLTLTEFLTARLDEDEAEFDAACEYEAEQLRHDGMPNTTGAEIREFWLRPETSTRWPRWMAEVEAKRRIVELAQQVNVRQDGAWALAHEGYLRALALPYASHPDYREEWAL